MGIYTREPSTGQPVERRPDGFQPLRSGEARDTEQFDYGRLVEGGPLLAFPKTGKQKLKNALRRFWWWLGQRLKDFLIGVVGLIVLFIWSLLGCIVGAWLFGGGAYPNKVLEVAYGMAVIGVAVWALYWAIKGPIRFIYRCIKHWNSNGPPY